MHCYAARLQDLRAEPAKQHPVRQLVFRMELKALALEVLCDELLPQVDVGLGELLAEGIAKDRQLAITLPKRLNSLLSEWLVS